MFLTPLLLSIALAWPGQGPANSGQAHRHSKLADVREELASEVVVVEASPDINLKKEQTVLSPNKQYEAFTVYAADDPAGYRLFYVDKVSGQTYEVRGIPLSQRPLTDVGWLNNRILMFDRWSQPHYGIHYCVDVIKKKLRIASAFPD